MDGPGVRQVPEGSGEQGKMENTGCEIIFGAPVTLAVKELIMLMIILAFTIGQDSLTSNDANGKTGFHHWPGFPHVK